MKLPHERFDYSAIVDRKPWRLPKGARIAVWTIVNIEEWDIEKPMARQYLPAPQGVSVVPDVPNWAWHDYGMRVGFWRMREALVKRKIPVTTSLNANVCRSYPRVAEAMRDAGWEFMGHAVKQGAMHTQPDPRAVIRDSIEIIREFTGKKPKGWLGPGLTETWETLDLLAEENVKLQIQHLRSFSMIRNLHRNGPLPRIHGWIYSVETGRIRVLVDGKHQER